MLLSYDYSDRQLDYFLTVKTPLLYELWTEDVGCQPGAKLTRHVVGERGLELPFPRQPATRSSERCLRRSSRWSFFSVYDLAFSIRLFVGGRAVELHRALGLLFASRTAHRALSRV